ncbi:MAG: LysM domain-containing protein, partial [Sulfuricaulis sp.]|nr:LysM domain-containing protein [Sulfuricaulis sp.]
MCSWAAAVPAATTADLAAGAPDRYVVVRGDTLWSIAGRFLKQPWRWGELWNMNRQQIRNPHRIYPGNVIVLDKSGAKLRLRLLRGGTDQRTSDTGGRAGDTSRLSGSTVKLSPQVRVTPLASESVPTIPVAAIEPFLGKPLVIAKNQLASAPRIVRTQENRVNLSAGDVAYVQGITKSLGAYWHLFRPGAAMIDPDTNETLGYEATFLGEAKLIRFGEGVSTLEIVKSPLEIHIGDYLLPAPSDVSLDSYVPRAPEKKIEARIISAYSGIDEVASLSIVALNKGARDGLEAGHVLAIYRDLNSTSTNRLRESPLFGRTGPIYNKNNPNTKYLNEPLATRGSPLYGRVGPFGFQYRD